MNREQLSATESVAELFKVTNARTRRRLVRRGDVMDWELVAEVLRAAGGLDVPDWTLDPIAGLAIALLARTRPLVEATALVAALQRQPDLTGPAELTPSEDAELRAVLRFLVRRYGYLTLAPLVAMSDDRARQELTRIPGVDVATACLILLHAFERPLLPPTPAVRRVLTRLGALSAGLSASESLRSLRLPAGLAVATLWHGLNQVANTTCGEDSTDCSHCPLQKFCARGRTGMQRIPPTGALTFVDLFAGAGGMSLGLTQAGLIPALAVEMEPWACTTYRANHTEMAPERVLCGDIRKIDPAEGQSLLGGVRPDVVAGGPPCQGFSLIGKRGRTGTGFIDDPRNQLYKEFIRWIDHLKPRLVIMENVPGLYSYADGAIRADIEQNLREIGFAVDDLLVDTSRLGVPQRRQRVIFIGAAVVDFGDQAQAICRRVVALLQEQTYEPISLREAIGDLPPLESGAGHEADAFTPTVAPSAYVRDLGERPGNLLYHHVARPVNLRDKLLYGRMRPGETGDDVLQQDARHLMVYRNDIFHDKYRRLRYEEPSPTIMSHLSKDGHMFIHPEQRRSITVREAARIQSFPDDFLFMGPRTAQFTQVGNAVPPRLAQAIARSIQQALAEVAL